MRFAFSTALAIAVFADGHAAACTLALGTTASEFNRARLVEIKRAPIVVEGYVEVRKFEAGRPLPLPVARLIARKTFKGSRKSYYPLNYVPTTCHVPFPTNKAKRQKVFLRGANGSYYIIHVEPLN